MALPFHPHPWIAQYGLDEPRHPPPPVELLAGNPNLLPRVDPSNPVLDLSDSELSMMDSICRLFPIPHHFKDETPQNDYYQSYPHPYVCKLFATEILALNGLISKLRCQPMTLHDCLRGRIEFENHLVCGVALSNRIRPIHDHDDSIDVYCQPVRNKLIYHCMEMISDTVPRYYLHPDRRDHWFQMKVNMLIMGISAAVGRHDLYQFHLHQSKYHEFVIGDDSLYSELCETLNPWYNQFLPGI